MKKWEDGMLLQIRDDGRAELYDDTYDITIHCSSKEEQDAARVLLKRAGAIPHWVSQDDIPRWIPCSERLPEESGYYIITAHDGVSHRTTFVKYQKKAKSWDLTGARSYWRVIAWMPMPEPYQE